MPALRHPPSAPGDGAGPRSPTRHRDRDGDPVANARRANRLLRLALLTMLASVVIGLPWDAAWHIRQPFETAFSPPHLFVYATTGIACCLYLALLAGRATRAAFGPGFAVPGVPFRVPGPLFLIGAGLGVLALAALLDVIWHTAFGLDETRWSTPHAMLGWGWGLATFGFASGRLALGRLLPVRWWTRLFFGLLLLGVTQAPVLGPFQNNQTPEKVAAIAALPVLAAQPEFQHTARIYRDWELTRGHPLLVVLGGLWAGLAIAVLRALDRRARFVLILVACSTAMMLLRDRGGAVRLGLDPAQGAHWLPLPLLPAALVAALCWRSRLPEALAVALGGAAFGVLTQLAWPSIGVAPAAIVGGLAAAGGALLGRRLGDLLAHPTRRGSVVLAAVAVGAPLVTGAVDLYLRLRTPWA